MDTLVLRYHDQDLHHFSLREAPLTLGSDSRFDVVVYDPMVPDYYGTLRRGQEGYRLRVVGAEKEIRLDYNKPIAVGKNHSLELTSAIPALPIDSARSGECTERLCHGLDAGNELTILVGSVVGGRKFRVSERSLSLGSSPDNQVHVRDATVSAHHCMFVPTSNGVEVRDLGSKNGTYLDGVRIASARLEPFSRLVVGRTNLQVLPTAEFIGRAYNVVAESPLMRTAVADLERYAKSPYPVLILGASGVGKERLARLVHDASERASEPFVAINAGGISPTLAESEFFGHERGAFTGAEKAHRGVFEQAHGGTLFLDEIGELSLDLQTRLLRVLEAFEVRRVGSESGIAVDVRVVAATHRDLRERARAGLFREDLYYRLARLVVSVPRLAERPEDIRALTKHFIDDLLRARCQAKFTAPAIERLLDYSWPGNARELRNVVECAAMTSGGVVDVRDIERALLLIGGKEALSARGELLSLEDILRAHHGNMSAAAKAHGISRSTFRDRYVRAGGVL